MIHFLRNKLQPTLLTLAYSGVFVGFTSGCFCGNRIFHVKYENRNLSLRHSLPLISSVSCAILFPMLLISTPIILIESFTSLCTLDKIIDNFNSKYSIKCKRYHQYDGNDNKYYAPSHLHITIKKIVK